MAVSEYHTPVLVDAVCAGLAPALAKPSSAGKSTYVDLTAGGGGHLLALVEVAPPQRVIAFDRDLEAIAQIEQHVRPILEGRGIELETIHAPFSRAVEELRQRGIAPQAVLADLGVSSHQLDDGSRGFSFREDAPLDMRMDPSQGISVAQWLQEASEREVIRVLRDFGEESDAERIGRALVATRPKTTLELARIVELAMSDVQKRKIGMRVHWATKTFQALRIQINGEFEQLEAMLEEMPELLAQDGRLGVISFHSIEDRIVKDHFRRRTRVDSPPSDLPFLASELPKADFTFPAKMRKPAEASAEGAARNPRSRSARFPVLQRVAGGR